MVAVWGFLLEVLLNSWNLLRESSLYMLFGLLVGGLLQGFISPAYVARHLGPGRFRSVFKAALFGVPLPLCSCGVLPAAASLKKQGANNGAITAFLIATPESGVDSICISWALLDPLMTVARPLAAFATALLAGILENLRRSPRPLPPLALLAAAAGEAPGASPSMAARLKASVAYAVQELWGDLAGWFFLGLLVAGVITRVVPESLLGQYLGGGLTAMLLMLLLGIPLYICATASTPIAAAMILKGVSPGAALVFLLVGPATNVASLFVLVGLLGRRATALYLATIAVVSVCCGLLLDLAYVRLGLSARALVGQAAETMPPAWEVAAALLLLALSVRPLAKMVRSWWRRCTGAEVGAGCGCGSGCAGTAKLPAGKG